MRRCETVKPVKPAFGFAPRPVAPSSLISPPDPVAAPPQGRKEVYEALLEARQACGQGVSGLTPAKLDKILDQQERDLSKRYGDSQVHFKVVVENGKAKLTASRGS